MEIKKFIKEEIFFVVKDPPVYEKEDYLELKENLFENIKNRLTIYFSYVLGIPFLIYALGLRTDLLKVETLLFTTVILTIASYFVIKREWFKNVNSLSNFYMGYLVSDFVWFPLLTHYFGGLSWIGIIFFTYYIIGGYLVLPKYRQGLILFLLTLFSVIIVGLIDYFVILPPEQLFPQGGILQQNLNFFLASCIGLFINLYFIGRWSFVFARKLKEQKAALRKERASLEEKVKERTAELEKEKVSLAEKVKERTKDLEISKEDLERKNREIGEANENLERMNKLMMGRELKMIELKKENEELKKKLV